MPEPIHLAVEQAQLATRSVATIHSINRCEKSISKRGSLKKWSSFFVHRSAILLPQTTETHLNNPSDSTDTPTRLWQLIALLVLVPILFWLIKETSIRPHAGRRAAWNDYTWCEDAPYLLRQTEQGVLFGEFQVRVDAINLDTGKTLWSTTLKDPSIRFLKVSENGRWIFVKSKDGFSIREFAPPHNMVREINLKTESRYWPSVHWVDDDTRLLYVTKTGYRIYDLTTDQDHALPESVEPYPFIGCWESDQFYTTVTDTGVAAAKQNVYYRDGLQLSVVPELQQPNGNRVFVFRDSTRMLLSESDSMIDTVTRKRIPLERPRGKGYFIARYSEDLSFVHEDANDRIVAMTIMDSETGKQVRRVDFRNPASGSSIYRNGKFIVIDSRYENVSAIDLDGESLLISESPFRRWLRRSLLAFTATLAWWFFWVLRFRRRCRSIKPFIDIALLHGIVFVASITRLFSGSRLGSMSQTETLFVVGATCSSIVLSAFWLVMGTSRWQRRVTQSIVATAICLWMYGSLFNFYVMWTIGTMLAGFATTCFAGFFLTRLIGQRFCHESDPTRVISSSNPSHNQIEIKQALVWVLACALVFAVAFADGVPTVNSQFLYYVVQGIVCAIVGVMGFFTLLRVQGLLVAILIAVLACTVVTSGLWYGVHRVFPNANGMLIRSGGSPAFFLIAQNVLLIASALTIRLNQYRLARQEAFPSTASFTK